jgi:hypothetical protein
LTLLKSRLSVKCEDALREGCGLFTARIARPVLSSKEGKSKEGKTDA